MKLNKKCMYILVLLIIFISYVLWDERHSLYNLKYGLVREALQNYENPILKDEANKSDAFLDKIRDKTDTLYGSFLKTGPKTNDDFMNSDLYFNPEVSQDIKYFNNATHLLIGLKLNDGTLV